MSKTTETRKCHVGAQTRTIERGCSRSELTWGTLRSFLRCGCRRLSESAMKSEAQGFWNPVLQLPGLKMSFQDFEGRWAESQCQAHSPYTLSCRIWVQARPPLSTSNTEKLPLSPDSSGPSSRLRLRCSWVRPRKREWYRVSREPRKDVARSSSEGQRDRQMASRTWKPGWHSAASSTEPPTWPCTWAPVTATGSGAARTTEPRHCLPQAPQSLLHAARSKLGLLSPQTPSTQVENALSQGLGIKSRKRIHTCAHGAQRGSQAINM